MLPPVDGQVLRDNPEFAKLYKMLLEKALNPDGSTRRDAATREREAAVQQDLHRARVERAKAHVLETALASISPEREPTAAPLAPVLALLPALLGQDQPLDAADAATAFSSPPLADLESLLPELGALVSADLHATALNLARVVHPSTNPSLLHRHIPSLPSDYAALAGEVSEARCALAQRRLDALASLTRLLSSCTQTLALLVQRLESKHGLALRRLELQALDVSQEAQLTELDAGTALNDVRRGVYSPEAISALTNYSAHLKDAQMRAAEQIKVLQAELADYGVGVESGREKERAMRDMASKYHETESQMEEVKKDLERLQRGV